MERPERPGRGGRKDDWMEWIVLSLSHPINPLANNSMGTAASASLFRTVDWLVWLRVHASSAPQPGFDLNNRIVFRMIVCHSYLIRVWVPRKPILCRTKKKRFFSGQCLRAFLSCNICIYIPRRIRWTSFHVTSHRTPATPLKCAESFCHEGCLPASLLAAC